MAYFSVVGRPKLSLIKYRVGKRLPELIRLWKEYESAHADKNIKDSASGPTLEILIPDEHFTTSNPGVAGSELWGTDIYTYDSDLVAVLMHMGYCHRRASPPSATEMLCATVRVLPPQDSYVSSLRNNVKSHARGAAVDCSYSIEQCCIVKEGGGTIDLEPNLTQTSTVGPTLAPVAAGHTTTSRAATSGALNQQYNLCNEPWSKFSISVVSDTVMKKTRYASARLKMGEVLYLETHSRRYELCFAGEKMVKVPIAEKPNTHSMNDAQNTKTRNTLMDVFRFSKCKKALPQNVMRSIGIPLPLGHVKVIAENLDWEDVQWSQTGVCIAGKEYKLALVHFLSPN